MFDLLKLLTNSELHLFILYEYDKLCFFLMKIPSRLLFSFIRHVLKIENKGTYVL